MDSDDDIYEALFGYNRALSIVLGYRDLMTRLHSERVHDLSMMIGLRCGLRAQELGTLKMASSFHDIGKIGIPDHILTKPSKLDAQEWETMKTHSELGERIMRASEIHGHPLADVARTIRHHHEHFDGSGYPDGLAGGNIPLLSRIVAIADSYDAMAVTRSYHAARKHDEIMDIMHSETGSKFEPRLMTIFSEHIEHSPMRAV